MAQYFQSEFYQQSPSTLDVTPEDDEMSVLDDKILDPSSEDLSNNRRTSYDAPPAYSHRDSVWSNYSNTSSGQSQPNSHSQLNHAMLNSTGASFMAVDGPQLPSYPQATWSMPRTDSGSCTPTVSYDPYAANGDQNGITPFSGGAVGPVGAMPVNSMSYRGGMAFATPGSVAMSPQSSQGWMPAPMDMAEAELNARKSPNYRIALPPHRGDAIRKRNSRIAISPELNLSNIDEAIRNCTDEAEKRKLKSDKRLLRNRDAALHSRQRKKKEAEANIEKIEQLEAKIKQMEGMIQQPDQLRAMIGQLKEELQNLQRARENLEYDIHQLTLYNEQLTEHIQRQNIEKDELIITHTRQTANLVKRNRILEERIQQLEHGAKPAQESQPGDFTSFENPTMESSPWDGFSMVTGTPLQPEGVQTLHIQASQQVKAPEKSNSGSDLPTHWNAICMFLLLGAFCASNSTSILGRSMSQLPEEYRAESANVLKAVLASPSSNDLANQHSINHGSTTGPSPATISGMEMAHMSSAQSLPSNLDQLHNTLVMPTEEQEREQAFSMNADQYNSLTTFEDPSGDFKPQKPSSLQQAFAAMRDATAQRTRMHSALSSGVHSRSLMWDFVPEKVVQDFHRMVNGHNYDTSVKVEGIFYP
ncbi:bZIP transcription factor bZIP-1 [Penicillium cf. griseofulvum]|uniref:BZIP transcription factor bZIP-1 n=1 Tax=Penicillium cf. griseofulvum TaxID=2972120 RepID=A0A9W9MYN6_9EURO|nr:bZIP transcription factor bZIP-1 [Penicillium cf. griseofulvum]KAJ5421364.1 bZIP transcription factor bZIP-1 [Penicillium cf. griseofulvum]KAJ5424599.1 bZIP transcription factor bZIP-1 [Penicillium cf. griseofulvum]